MLTNVKIRAGVCRTKKKKILQSWCCTGTRGFLISCANEAICCNCSRDECVPVSLESGTQVYPLKLPEEVGAKDFGKQQMFHCSAKNVTHWNVWPRFESKLLTERYTSPPPCTWVAFGVKLTWLEAQALQLNVRLNIAEIGPSLLVL